jgi:ElaB/YqjD/DUF883 family membrane-anchored ribosome-binding protein
MESRTNEELSSRASETIESARAKTQEFASATAARARDMTSRFGHRVREFAGKVREGSPHEKVRATTNQVADTLENAGTYLEDKSFQGMIDDVAGVIRKYPMQSLLIGIGIGFLLSRKKTGKHPAERSYHRAA